MTPLFSLHAGSIAALATCSRPQFWGLPGVGRLVAKHCGFTPAALGIVLWEGRA
jgi:hypothetical protein